MRVAVLHYAARPPWSTVQLLNAFMKLGVDASYIVWDYFTAHVDSDCVLRYSGRCLPYSSIIVRGLGRGLTPEQLLYRYTVLKAAEEQGVLVVNPVDPMFTARNKLLSLIELERCGIPVPETIATENPGIALRLLRDMGKAVVKPLTGSLGLGSFLVDVDTAYYIFNLLTELKQPIYMQRYIEKDDNSDIRAFIVNGEVIAAIKRRSTTSWKTNIAQGASAEPIVLDDEAENLAIRAAECLGLFYAGVDIAAEKSSGRLYVLEVNASPQWRGLTRATGVNPAIYIARAVVERLMQRKR